MKTSFQTGGINRKMLRLMEVTDYRNLCVMQRFFCTVE